MGGFEKSLDFIKILLFNALSQFFWLFGLLFIFGFILYLLARFTRTTYVKTAGSTLDVFVTGWIGTPIHELSHALFCIIFRHQITEIKLYSPNKSDGTLGYVNHSYNSKSLYQRIGNFFIGIAPVIIGAIVIYLLFLLLVPNSEIILGSLDSQSKILIQSIHGKFEGIFSALNHSTTNTLKALLSRDNFMNYKFWIFLYAALSISSHMELSPADIKGAWSGLLIIMLLLLLMNIIVLGFEYSGISNHFGQWWQFIKLEYYSVSINKGIGTLGAIFIFSTIFSLFNFITTFTILNIYSLLKRKGIVNPFW